MLFRGLSVVVVGSNTRLGVLSAWIVALDVVIEVI